MDACGGQKPESVPASPTPLGSHKEDPKFDERVFGFSYASAVDSLMYLTLTCPEIQLAVHQCP